MPIRAQLFLRKEMPKEIAIYKPDIIPDDEFLVTYEVNGTKTVKAVKATGIIDLLGPNSFENSDKEKQAFIEWLAQ